MPGPASTVEERSLRKDFAQRGPRFDPRGRKLLFRRDLFIENASHKCLTEILYRMGSSNHKTLPRKSAIVNRYSSE